MYARTPHAHLNHLLPAHHHPSSTSYTPTVNFQYSDFSSRTGATALDDVTDRSTAG